MELEIRKDSPALECVPKIRTGRISCNVLNPNAVLPTLELNCLSFDSSRFLEVQLIGNPEPFPWPRPDGQTPEKNQCVSIHSSGQSGSLFGQLTLSSRKESHIRAYRTSCCPLAVQSKSVSTI